MGMKRMALAGLAAIMGISVSHAEPQQLPNYDKAEIFHPDGIELKRGQLCDASVIDDLTKEVARLGCLGNADVGCIRSLGAPSGSLPNGSNPGATASYTKDQILKLVPVSGGLKAVGDLTVEALAKRAQSSLTANNGSNSFTAFWKAQNEAKLVQKIQGFASSAFLIGLGVAVAIDAFYKPDLREEGKCPDYSAARIGNLWNPDTHDCEPVYNLHAYEVRKFLKQDRAFKVNAILKNPFTCAYYNELLNRVKAENDADWKAAIEKPLRSLPECQSGSINYISGGEQDIPYDVTLSYDDSQKRYTSLNIQRNKDYEKKVYPQENWPSASAFNITYSYADADGGSRPVKAKFDWYSPSGGIVTTQTQAEKLDSYGETGEVGRVFGSAGVIGAAAANCCAGSDPDRCLSSTFKVIGKNNQNAAPKVVAPATKPIDR